VLVRDEFKHIESYLTIQKIRYRDILDYTIEYERETGDMIMLKLLLQPLVENALYHGIKNKRGRGIISVKGWKEDGFLRFRVADNGIGMTLEQLDSLKEQLTHPPESFMSKDETRGYGLYNIAKRLELYYNRKGLLDIRSVYGEGTEVMLLIPCSMMDDVKPYYQDSEGKELQRV
jgi:two-component system sensor histidine kinase YesM